MKANFQEIYDLSPYSLKVGLLNLYSLKLKLRRRGVYFQKILRENNDERIFSEGFKSLQLEMLRGLLRHAGDNVPFYKQLFEEHCFNPSVQDLSDLEKLPILTKNDVKRIGGDLISKIHKKNLSKGGTSGTTGSPLIVYWDKKSQIVNEVADFRQKSWAGLNQKDRIAMLTGRAPVSPSAGVPPFWVKDYIQNRLWVSSFHLGPKYGSEICQAIVDYRPAAVEGYPSTLYELAKLFASLSIRPPVEIRSLLCSSEPLYGFQREFIEKIFGVKIFNFYGHAERAVFAPQCEYQTDRHHVLPDYGIVEIVDESGRNVPDGCEGRLVTTSLHNYGMPLIRYDTGDRTWKRGAACKCGRHGEEIGVIDTKSEDVVVSRDGSNISPSVLTHPFKLVTGVIKSQILQRPDYSIIVRLVTDDSFSKEEFEKLRQGLIVRLKGEKNLRFEFVEDIPRTGSGKYRWIISEVKK